MITIRCICTDKAQMRILRFSYLYYRRNLVASGEWFDSIPHFFVQKMHRLLSCLKCTNIRTTAKEIEFPERKFVKLLLNRGFLYRSPSGTLLPYAVEKNNDLFIVKDYFIQMFSPLQRHIPNQRS